MKKHFSLLQSPNFFLNFVEVIYNSIKISLGPTGKTGLASTKSNEIKVLASGSLIIKFLDFPSTSENIIKKLFEQASLKTSMVSGDGSTTAILVTCYLLKSSLKLILSGYNPIFLSNGLKKFAYFFLEKILDFSQPVLFEKQLEGIITTSSGKKLNNSLLKLLKNSTQILQRDGVILVEEGSAFDSSIESIQGIELDKGFLSSYFVNDLKNFEVNYTNPYLLITTDPLTSFSQIQEIIEHIKESKRPLVIITEEISKEILSTLILNTIQKKFSVSVVKYNTIKFLKTGILEDLALLTYSNYFPNDGNNKKTLSLKKYEVKDLGQLEKSIIKKEKTTFLVSKFSKILAKRRINELTREVLTCENDYEKNILKTRIARLSGNIIKIKIGSQNSYQIQEEKIKIENIIQTLKSSLEEGVLPGGGCFYLYLKDEIKNWSYLNLVGEEYFSAQIVNESLIRPFIELCENTNQSFPSLYNLIQGYKYPYTYDFLKKDIVNSFDDNLLDSSKSVRSILWNSLTLVSALIIAD
jgi:chaperonin GroEL